MGDGQDIDDGIAILDLDGQNDGARAILDPLFTAGPRFTCQR